jgi:hypothetical protein
MEDTVPVLEGKKCTSTGYGAKRTVRALRVCLSVCLSVCKYVFMLVREIGVCMCAFVVGMNVREKDYTFVVLVCAFVFQYVSY